MPTIMQEYSAQVTGGRWAGEALSAENLAVFPGKVDPAQFPTADGTFVRLTADAAVGATSLAVSPISNPIPANTILDFGNQTAQTVTVADTTIANGDTTLGVEALAAPISKNTVLDFGSGKVAVLSASAAAGATSLTVYPLQTASLPANGNTATVPAKPILAEVTALAAAGATTISVRALSEDIPADAIATYPGTSRIKPVPSGTLLGRTLAERDANVPFGPWATGDDEVYLLAFDVVDANTRNNAEFYRNQRVVREDLLPDWADYSPAKKAALRAAYQCVKAVV